MDATPYHSVKSKSPGSKHHWFNCNLEGKYTKGHKWKYGDFIHSKGYIIIWNPDETLPAILQNLREQKEQHTIERYPHIGKTTRLVENAVKTLPNASESVSEGMRNNTLNPRCVQGWQKY